MRKKSKDPKFAIGENCKMKLTDNFEKLFDTMLEWKGFSFLSFNENQKDDSFKIQQYVSFGAIWNFEFTGKTLILMK